VAGLFSTVASTLANGMLQDQLQQKPLLLESCDGLDLHTACSGPWRLCWDSAVIFGSM
jgi:hypothetical protein